ncbi:MAG: four helix bundle protein [Planctomycetes bacterium]|nr:four helix bundle protein [Planctomycetota bacterium]
MTDDSSFDIQHSFDLEERLLEFAARIIRLSEALPNTQTGKHVAGQILRSGTSPMAQHGEAQGAESRKDFLHKMKIALKELRETGRWLKLITRVSLIEKTELLDPLIKETDELTRIFVTSIRTAKANAEN